MDTNLKNKHVLITGASGGIGQETAKKLAEEGARLSLHYFQNEKRMENLEKQLNTEVGIYKADMRSHTAIKEMFKDATSNFGRIDHIVINHGIWPEQFSFIQNISLERWDSTLSVNLTSYFLCSKYFFKNLEDYPGEDASIVFIGSTAGIFGEAGHADYSATKAALKGLTLSLKNEIIHFARRGRVNLVAPGWTITPMTEKFMDDHDGIKNVLQTMPLRKIARADDIANSVLFLLSNLSNHISGQIITVAGGMEGRKLFEKDEIDLKYV
ncbi:MAG: SDR family NAD(P)-dependent oxidoreductase [Candidatus Hodarchaeales archaeon]